MRDAVPVFEAELDDALFHTVNQRPAFCKDDCECEEIEDEQRPGKPLDADGGEGNLCREVNHAGEIFDEEVGGVGDDFSQGVGDKAHDGSEESEEHGAGDDRTGDQKVAEWRD